MTVMTGLGELHNLMGRHGLTCLLRKLGIRQYYMLADMNFLDLVELLAYQHGYSYKYVTFIDKHILQLVFVFFGRLVAARVHMDHCHAS